MAGESLEWTKVRKINFNTKSVKWISVGIVEVIPDAILEKTYLKFFNLS